MIYVFDTSPFIVLSHYFPTRFPSFWERLNRCVSDARILSVREVFRELDNHNTKPHVKQWIDENRCLFLTPGSEETKFVREIFSEPEGRLLVPPSRRLKNGPIADPWVIAVAKLRGACVVTEENRKDDAIRIPNVCERFAVDCTSLEGLMEREGWSF